ncbi:uncharacterized protein TRIADDRAFT_54326 [Trichoplax adhaerens]|uniref:Fructose-2,6-bisphosphatase TIGAR n=1 Tax=Trichoplax adhaerens TaxID=10228 RepID=B3RRQ4_TRIAD|nr:hypothetical protein TRIADDRAFT_54326 [Trichoplax adhaerens]EDV26910.1 hypothetical protein TRIADDRAFT_54326 [Trichoplax adhaerens]|eukprot:XP_002110906.1 hypothetical protein TRIADDRAFT_54326 [Trichoplax adhaerens]
MAERVFKLTVVRHGETEANSRGIIQGHTDCPLSNIGRQQADLLGKRLSGSKFTHLFSSDLKRARQTMDAVVLANISDVEVIEDRRLRERNYGVHEGITFSELRKVCKRKHIGMENIKDGPDAEDTKDLYSRALMDFATSNETLLPIVDCKNDVNHSDQVMQVNASILITTHGGLIRQMLRYFNSELGCNLLYDDIRKCSPNTGVSTFLIRIRNHDCKILVQRLELHSERHLKA